MKSLEGPVALLIEAAAMRSGADFLPQYHRYLRWWMGPGRPAFAGVLLNRLADGGETGTLEVLRQRRSCGSLWRMTKRFPVVGSRRKKSPVNVDWSGRVLAMRERVGLTQKEFAAMVGVSSKTLENWEQGRRQPAGPASVLLTVLEREPDAVMRAQK